ncbi:AzlC family protein [Streptococcus pneumoniae]|uniref:AzlC family protein n=2 Tax=Streptococcus pneumoniae TaxID=1313 RepID=Q8CZ95_STRR6|nr:Hypothetical protein spr0145 [Streptococcus pneumoniae R6]AVN85325.1 Branched-chain amino acid transport protein AzlC [Streptococcus pneumoniae]OLV91399.1 Hypothetical protein SPCCCB_spr0145 [Streptococcus pneumoniae CCCB]QBK28016.1 AzlC protein [Streptococcus pneumoniae]QEL27571.1 AzlC protein [Streptococcus pneumoniae]
MLWLDSFQSTYTLRNSLQTTSASPCRSTVTDFVSSIHNLKTVVQAPVAAIAMTVFLINLRLFLLSLHASTYFRHTSLWYNIGMSSILTDETYGVLMGELAHTDKVNPMWMHGNNLNSYVAWFVGTVVGTALGGLLPNPEIFALILSSVVTGKVGSLPQIKWLDFLAVFPTAWVAFRYRNLVGTVLFGVVLIAILRLVF